MPAPILSQAIFISRQTSGLFSPPLRPLLIYGARYTTGWLSTSQQEAGPAYVSGQAPSLSRPTRSAHSTCRVLCTHAAATPRGEVNFFPQFFLDVPPGIRQGTPTNAVPPPPDRSIKPRPSSRSLSCAPPKKKEGKQKKKKKLRKWEISARSIYDRDRRKKCSMQCAPYTYTGVVRGSVSGVRGREWCTRPDGSSRTAPCAGCGPTRARYCVQYTFCLLACLQTKAASVHMHACMYSLVSFLYPEQIKPARRILAIVYSPRRHHQSVIAIAACPARQPSSQKGLKCLRTASAISPNGVRVHVWLDRNNLSLQRRTNATVKRGKRRSLQRGGGAQLASPPSPPSHFVPQQCSEFTICLAICALHDP